MLTSSSGFNPFLEPASFWNLSMLDRIRAAMTPRWSRAIVLAALLSVCELVLISSNDETWTTHIISYMHLKQTKTRRSTINFDAILNIRLAAGHSGQKRTTSRSSMRLSKMRRYSASFEFLVVFPFPDLRTIKHTNLFQTDGKHPPLGKENDHRLRRFHRRI